MGRSQSPARDAYIDGEWIAGSRRFTVRDPYDDQPIAEVTAADDRLSDAAIAAAEHAFPGWRDRSGPERGQLLAAFAAAMVASEHELAELCSRENGKPLGEAIAEVRYAASFAKWFAGEAERSYGETIPATRATTRIVITREPVGPCAAITPWNFPYAMVTRKLAPALAAGCTMVAKPAEQTPLCALALARIAERVGIPPGVFNVVPTDQPAAFAARVTAARAIRKLSFTGSTAVGRTLARAAADQLQRVSLELGGNAPFIVLADADLDAAVAGAMVAKFRNAGQSCVAANRFIIDRSVADRFCELLIAAITKLRWGRGLDCDVDLGPLINDAAVAKQRRLVDDAIARGARLRHGELAAIAGRIVPPIVLDQVCSEMAVWREEIFGPIVALRTAGSPDEALALANDSEHGLAAFVYTRDAHTQRRFAEQLAVGMVGVNEGLISTAQAPFGGVNQSGYGREGSRHGLDDYTHWKYVAAN